MSGFFWCGGSDGTLGRRCRLVPGVPSKKNEEGKDARVLVPGEEAEADKHRSTRLGETKMQTSASYLSSFQCD